MPHVCIPFYANYTILATQKGGHGTMPPKYAPGYYFGCVIYCFFFLTAESYFFEKGLKLRD